MFKRILSWPKSASWTGSKKVAANEFQISWRLLCL